MIDRDTTNAMPHIIAHGLAIVRHMKYSGKYSKTYLRKVGLLPNKWKSPGLGWKANQQLKK
ncbi:hypothetical protein KAU11_11135 [Candidatus Babeliales bacterium]|nr:hypothetical protein [Candidatus Babeliales bacterium]